MDASELIACRELLKEVHITKLQVIMRSQLVIQARKKTVLVKIVIHDLLAKVDMKLIIQDK